MVRGTIWRRLRWRVLGVLPLVCLPALLVVWSYATKPPNASLRELQAYLDAAWFNVPGASAVFLYAAIIVSTPGTLMRPRPDVHYLFALPVARTRWVAAHLAMSLAALAGLVLLTGVIFATAAAALQAPLSLGALLSRSLGTLAAASPWVFIALGATALVRHPVAGAFLALAILVWVQEIHFLLDLPARISAPLRPAWDPWLMADPRTWQGGVPFRLLGVAAAAAAAGVSVALYRLERFEP